jgi:hypothetical protein
VEKLKRSRVMVICSAILLLFILLAGCQVVGGYDVNKALTSNLKVQSYEGKSSVSFEFMWDETYGELNDELAILKSLGEIRVDLYDVKMKDIHTMSAKGGLHFSRGEIPFFITLTEEEMAIEIEGAERPILISLMGAALPYEFAEIQEELSGKSAELLQTMGGFLISNAPNPKNISLSTGMENVNDQSLFLYQVHAEVYADEILGLIKQTLVNILADEEGLKEVLGQVYDILMPVVIDALRAEAESSYSEYEEFDEYDYYQEEDMFTDLYGDYLSMVVPYLENKTLVVEFLYTTIHVLLDPIVEEFDELSAELVSDDEFDFFNEQSYVKTDLYFDTSMNLRKQDFEVVIEPNLQDNEGLKGVRITGTQERWNVNQAVNTDVLDTSDAYEVDLYSDPMELSEMVDQDSILYDLLKEDLKIFRKEIYLFVSNDDEELYNHAYIKNQTAMVPVRFISEELGAKVLWDAETNQVTVSDPLTETEIILTVGSTTAHVDGEAVQLPIGPEFKNGSVYVPVRFIVESLGGIVEWDSEYGMVLITKD